MAMIDDEIPGLPKGKPTTKKPVVAPKAAPAHTPTPTKKVEASKNAPASRRAEVVAEKPAEKITASKKPSKGFVRFIHILMTLGMLGGMAGAFLYHRYNAVVSNPSFPKLEELINQPVEVTTEVYDNTGTHLIGEIFQTRRTKVQLKDVSPNLIAALLAAEDANYFQHHGVDWYGTLKGLVRHPGHPTGGSTITQQVIKNLLWLKRGVTPRNFDAKVEEWILARALEKILSKDQILELYLNTIYLGQNRYGVEAASRNYFGKNAAEISLGEAALLVALPKGPNTYTHWTNPAGKAKALAKWKTRQLYVLDRMGKLGKAKADEAKAAADAPIQLAESAGIDLGIGDEFVDVVQKELVKIYGPNLFRTQLKVKTTADWSMQNASKKALEEGTKTLDHLNGENPRPQAAQMTIDQNGNVLAMVGGWGYRRGQRSFNRATQAARQPGSLFKTLLWTAAFEGGKHTLDSTFVDQECTLPAPEAGAGTWTPHDHHEATGEPIDLGLALAKSLNRVACQLVYAFRTENNPLAGVDLLIEMANRLGVSSKLGRNYALVLGTSNVRLSEMAVAYNTISNGGKRPNLRYILSIQEGNANAKQESFKDPVQVVKPSTAHMTNIALQRVTTEGTGVRAGRELRRPIAGKTGTSQEEKDGWFCGSISIKDDVFTTCTWVGYDNNASLGKVQVGSDKGKDFEGSSTALRQIWIPFAKAVFQGKPVEEFKMPTDEVDTTGAAAQPATEEAAPTTEQPAAETPATPETEEEKLEPVPVPF